MNAAVMAFEDEIQPETLQCAASSPPEQEHRKIGPSRPPPLLLGDLPALR